MSNSTSETVIRSAYGYVPDEGAALAVGIIFSIVSVAIFFRLFRRSRKDLWGLALPIGVAVYAGGLIVRHLLAANQSSTGLLIASQLCIVLAPASFLAFNYIVYGRLVRNRVGARFSLMRPTWVARIFVLSDVVTFLVQAVGASIESGTNVTAKAEKLGSNILLVGIILQLVSYIIYVLLLVHTHWRLTKEEKIAPSSTVRRVIWTLYFSSLFILIRGIYRGIELSQGDNGFLTTHEAYFYALDALPLFFATAVYVPVWPGPYVEAAAAEDPIDMLPLSNGPYSS